MVVAFADGEDEEVGYCFDVPFRWIVSHLCYRIVFFLDGDDSNVVEKQSIMKFADIHLLLQVSA